MLIACMTVALHGATQTVVFDTDVPSGQYYRIPAMVQLHDGRLLAIADDRHGSDIDIGGNWGIDIVGRVSSDGGQTWEPPFMIADGDGRREGFRDSHGDAAVAAMAEQNGYIYMDLYGALADENGWLAEDEATDGIHFTAAKYTEWAEFLRTYPYERNTVGG